MAQQRVHYIHHLSYSMRERVVGAFVLLALAVVFGLIFINSRTSHLFEDRLTFHAYLKNAQGVSTESLVKISGLEVGRVSAVEIAPDNRVHLQLTVFQRFHNLLRTDSRASLSKLAVLGQAVIDISAGSPDAPLLAEGATLEIEEPKSLDELMADLTPVLAKVNQIVDGMAVLIQAVNPAEVRTISQELAQTLVSVRQIGEQVAAGKGALGQMVFDKKTESDMTHALSTLDALLVKADQRLTDLEPLMKDAGSITTEGRNTTRELTGLVAESKQMVGQLNTTMGTVNVELQQLPELISRMKLLMDATDRTLQGMQRIWPLSSAMEPPSGETVLEAHPGHD